MAIARADYEVFRFLRDNGHVPDDRSILEIGEAEYYGDVPLETLRADVAKYAPADMRGNLTAYLDSLIRSVKAGRPDGIGHPLARVVYQTFFGPCRADAIDLHGTAKARPMDLNCPEVPRGYGIVYNTGTAEHIFRIGGVLEFCHDATIAGGLMVHCLPFTGLIDHGFYSVQPGLIADLAEANGYEILAWTLSELRGDITWLDGSDPGNCIGYFHDLARAGTLPANAWFHVAFRKAGNDPFEIPRQRVYSDRATRQTYADWKALR